MFINGKLVNTVLTDSHNDFPLKGMINPTFQNTGEASVLIDGREIKTGESYAINAPNVILTNNVSIIFENDPAKTKVVHVGYVETSITIEQDTI